MVENERCYKDLNSPVVKLQCVTVYLDFPSEFSKTEEGLGATNRINISHFPPRI